MGGQISLSDETAIETSLCNLTKDRDLLDGVAANQLTWKFPDQIEPVASDKLVRYAHHADLVDLADFVGLVTHAHSLYAAWFQHARAIVIANLVGSDWYLHEEKGAIVTVCWITPSAYMRDRPDDTSCAVV